MQDSSKSLWRENETRETSRLFRNLRNIFQRIWMLVFYFFIFWNINLKKKYISTDLNACMFTNLRNFIFGNKKKYILMDLNAYIFPNLRNFIFGNLKKYMSTNLNAYIFTNLKKFIFGDTKKCISGNRKKMLSLSCFYFLISIIYAE